MATTIRTQAHKINSLIPIKFVRDSVNKVVNSLPDFQVPSPPPLPGGGVKSLGVTTRSVPTGQYSSGYSGIGIHPGEYRQFERGTVAQKGPINTGGYRGFSS